ncbi:uncharacterized protein [Drosophila virilis]|uniref:Uncharacterized protein n=1 Tax=Drosophila virilis TaxID=7244 RepID=B4MDG8_DROVI|nr:uncharacterized protein LOC6635775 [Drosophila virilis]EDW71229.1 uncharacterized protein Dvir_GJ16247 [Drosophila virilis]
MQLALPAACFQLLLLSCLWHGHRLEFVQIPEQQLEHNELLALLEDDLDLSQVNWRAMIPLLLQRQQVRLCVAVYRYEPQLVAGTSCEALLSNGLMAYCDIGHVEDLSMTMRAAFGGMLFDTLQQCRPGLEIFGVRCRRRA